LVTLKNRGGANTSAVRVRAPWPPGIKTNWGRTKKRRGLCRWDFLSQKCENRAKNPSFYPLFLTNRAFFDVFWPQNPSLIDSKMISAGLLWGYCSKKTQNECKCGWWRSQMQFQGAAMGSEEQKMSEKSPGWCRTQKTVHLCRFRREKSVTDKGRATPQVLRLGFDRS